jgi:hypothetical protein
MLNVIKVKYNKHSNLGCLKHGQVLNPRQYRSVPAVQIFLDTLNKT